MFLFSHHRNNIILPLKHRCVEFISIKLPTIEKSNQKTRKTRDHLSVRKNYWTILTGIGGRKTKEVISNSKTTTMTYF